MTFIKDNINEVESVTTAASDGTTNYTNSWSQG